MQNKLVWILSVVFILSLQGCETFKGAAQGFKKDVEDYQNKDTALHKADNWMRENMW